MAKIRVKNFREHDIILSSMASTNKPLTVMFPAAHSETDEKTQQSRVIPGEAEVESADLDAIKKDNVVAKSYFDEGALRVDNSRTDASKKDE